MMRFGTKTNQFKVRYDVVFILKGGESQRPERLACIDLSCNRTMAKVNREVAHVIKDNKGVHWSDVPEDVTVVEHKCRGCPTYYHIYTPRTPEALASLEDKYNV